MADQWDKITLRGLSAVGSHGVHDFERQGAQVYTADITLYVDVSAAVRADDVEQSVDYSQVAEDAVAVLSGPTVYLIETLADNLAQTVLGYPRVQKVEVTVHKPMAPVRHHFQDVSVTLVRHRDSQESQLQSKVSIPRGQDSDTHAQIAANVMAEAAAVAATSSPEEKVIVEAEEPPVKTPHTGEIPSLPLRPTRLARRATREQEPTTEPVVTGADPREEANTQEAADTQEAPVTQEDTAAEDSAAEITEAEDTAAEQVPRPTRLQSRRANITADLDKTSAHHVYSVVIALGANRGNVVSTLRQAVTKLMADSQIEVTAVSPLVRTAPVLEQGALPQDDYYNAVVLAKTTLAPPTLLWHLQELEDQFGRTRAVRWSSRTLDLDIIELDGMFLNTKDLTVPHPRAHERAFVLFPWLQVDGQATLPGHGSVEELLGQTQDLGGLLEEYPNWLSDDFDAPLEPGTELHLAPRPPSLSTRSVPAVKDETVTVRGQNLPMTSVQEAPIFGNLLSKDQQQRKTAPRKAPPRKTLAHKVAQQGPKLRKLAPPKPQRRAPEKPQQAPATPAKPVWKQVRPQQESRAETVREENSNRELPEWNFAVASPRPRVIDSLERQASTEPSPPAQNDQLKTEGPRLKKGVTVRPTPTGSIPIYAPPQQGRRQGRETVR